MYFQKRNRRARDAGRMQNALAGLVQNAHRTTLLRRLVALVAVIAPAAAAFAEVRLPDGATLTAESVELESTYAMPIGAWHEASAVPTAAMEGRVTRQAWRLGGTGMSSYQILINLRQQILDAGYEVVFECEDSTCGGFDFRYGTAVIGEPEMHVDLGDFQFLSATMPGPELGAVPEAVSLLVSRSASAGFVQVIQVGRAIVPAAATAPTASTKAEPGNAMPATLSDDIGAAMESIGRFHLADLVFPTGFIDLGPRELSFRSPRLAQLPSGETPKKPGGGWSGHTDPGRGFLGRKTSSCSKRGGGLSGEWNPVWAKQIFRGLGGPG